ncbi:MAG: ribonuclease J [Acholeplasma sp.]|nr:ribonuclease J [Acholeplasma sp.]
MSKNALLKDGDIGIFALGGLGEVGKNTYVYEIEDKIFLVDAGILFPDNSLLGIDYVIPDYSYLVENQERIVGLFITHGHEDHIGGIPYLLRQVKIPKIYAAGIAVDFIEHKLLEARDIKKPRIIEYKSHHTYSFGSTEISFVRLNHSIPDMFGIAFKTKQGVLFHTGDFKIDYTPVGPAAEYEKLAHLGNEGVLCLMSDSTNAERDGLTPSERTVGTAISEIFSKLSGRIIIATFASNMYRMQQIVEASYKNGRKLAVFGRSMERAMEIGQQTGYVRAPKGTIVSGDQINQYKADEVTILCTGSQGEPLAALSRIANGTHRQIKTQPGDTVIFSSSPIPGNQESVNRTIDQLYRRDVNVIINGPVADTHTSGHGNKPDLQLMLSLIRPKFFIPIHGEHRMLKHHKEIAVELGVERDNILIMDNGDVAAVNATQIRHAGKVQAGDIYIDGTGIGDIGSAIIKERKMLSEDGLLSIILTLDPVGKKLLTEPTVISRGFIYMKGNEAITNGIGQKAKEILLSEFEKKQFSEHQLKIQIVEQITEYVKQITQRKPMVIPVLMSLTQKV